MASEVSESILDDARLLVSELVANAIEHVREEGTVEVRVRLQDGMLRVEVLDPGPGFSPPPPPEDSDRGWGLRFVDRVATRWAIDRDGRNRVWFELALTDS